ncbi:MAG: carbon monoxide dehydrogenase [Chloroflexi bacterium]|nr:MAG: carbon monoxide dehydrogenase [Chloroflexota bacterium]
MTTTIAVAGKGGTGKTTVCAMIIRYLTRHGLGPVLAIDADPSSNLNLVLGLPLDERETVGHIREDMLAQVQTDKTAGVMTGGLVSGLTKHDYFDYHIRSIIVEGDDVDLLAMGRPEGPGCYCPANNAMRLVIDRLSDQYPFVVMDNEAGLEHLSRRTTRDVEHLLLVTDPSQRGVVAARRAAELVSELNIRVGQLHLVVNRLPGGTIPPTLQTEIETVGAPLLGVIPADNTLLEFEFSGRPLIELGDDSPVYQAVAGMMKRLAIGP